MLRRPILIVEDEPDLRETLQELLELAGYKVATAANGREALARLDEIGPVCLILLDLMMPVMSGWEFLDALKSSASQVLASIPVVVVSATADVADVKRLGGCRVMKKPVDLELLMAVVQEYCEMG